MTSTPAPPPAPAGPPPIGSRLVRAFHQYGHWLASISWKRFLLLSLLLLVLAGVLGNLLPSWSYETDELLPPQPTKTSRPKAAVVIGPQASGPGIHIRREGDGDGKAVEVRIDGQGVRITRQADAASAPARPPVPPVPPVPPLPVPPPTAASAPTANAASAPGTGAERVSILVGGKRLLDIHLPPGEAGEEVRRAIEGARDEIAEAVREAAEAAAEASAVPAEAGAQPPRYRRVRVAPGDALPELAFLWIVISAIMKVSYRRQIAAEATAAQAVETAEAESLKRQVVEARMAAMQAQVEPHFLFNTLASIDHLIEVNPQRASQMQKNLIALLRASMPTMREASGNGQGGQGARDLGRELAVIRPYLEILKVRMEERLATEIDVPEGLLSAEFPPMMVQTLVENAIKHGLEPKPEGGQLTLKAEIVHGKLAVTVADTGLGFGQAPTAGTGVGLANIRERLQLLYGAKATLTVAENPGGGTRVTISLPYKPVEGAPA